MELVLSFALGVLSGLIYSEHIYRQASIFPSRSLLYSFWIRILILFILMAFVAIAGGLYHLLSFSAGNLMGRAFHIALRLRLTVR